MRSGCSALLALVCVGAQADGLRVLWRGVMIGYLPRAANFEAADEMDAGARLSARIGQLAPDPDPWKRLRVDVWIELGRTGPLRAVAPD
jgi:hypothetical protein